MHRKKISKEYGQPLTLYPGLTLRVGSMMQILPSKMNFKKEAVDNLVDNTPLSRTISKKARNRAICLKTGQ
jgi:hypothetical protein